MAGGGIKPGVVHGETDDFSYNVVENPVHIHDLNATILHCLGIDHRRLTLQVPGPRHAAHRRRGAQPGQGRSWRDPIPIRVPAPGTSPSPRGGRGSGRAALYPGRTVTSPAKLGSFADLDPAWIA